MSQSELFHITGDHIARLKDDDLRELVGLLCEADYRAAGLSTRGISWGGHQDSPDGGLDVVVHDSITPPANSFVPRSYTGFQVKKPAMGPAEVLKEMKPKGDVRDAIKELIAANGSYIIISSKASTSHKAKIARTNAMKAAVSGIIGSEKLMLDFYDRGNIATWVRSHPPLILWIREKIGAPLYGWKPYGNWSASPSGVSDEYLLDEELRLYHGTSRGDQGENGIDAIQYLRKELSQPNACIRLIGLSGVGKTRFVQALFDERIGSDAIAPSRAVYADVGDGLSPDPVSVATRMIHEKANAILIIDNCNPDLHKMLKDVCISSESKIGLLTIEYDVRDDLPEDTDVFRLEPASQRLISKLIEHRFSHIGKVDAETISDVSGGNARVAIALAGTVNKGETIGHLRSEELFKRLFQQRNDSDEKLLQCAEVLSLVYSFEGTDVESSTSEIKVLAGIIELPPGQLFRGVSTLRDRGLIQARDVWRALLPHAIANRLATDALASIPKKKILDAFMVEGNERLLRSFTRRLSYLHDSEGAIEIAKEWLTPGGLLGQTNGNLNQLGIEILLNIAPVVPEKVVELLESWANRAGGSGVQFTSPENVYAKEYVRILRLIAYDPNLFKRCALLIGYFVLAEDPNEKLDSVKNVIKSLFYIHLSGTQASAELRAEVIKDFWNSGREAEQKMTFLLLDAALEASHIFPLSNEFNFGARLRDYGWQPKNYEDITHWYKTFIRIASDFALSDSDRAGKARKLLADKFPSLWSEAGMHQELEDISDNMLQLGPWNEGWLAVRGIIKYDSHKLNTEIQRLKVLEEKLKPSNLEEMARVYAFSDSILTLEFVMEDADHRTGKTKTEEFTEELGKKVATDLETFSNLLPELVKAENQLSFSFGKGLAEGALDKLQLWKMIQNAYDNVQNESIGITALLGMFSSPSMDGVRDSIMDSLVLDPVLGKYFPYLQLTVPINPVNLFRINRSIDMGIASIHLFKEIGNGNRHEIISDQDLVTLLRKIIVKKDGLTVAIHILSKRFDSQEQRHSKSILELTIEILTSYPYKHEKTGNTHRLDHNMANLADKCLVNRGAGDAAIKISKSLVNSINKYEVFINDFPHLIGKLAQHQPFVFLDEFLAPLESENYHLKSFFSDDLQRNRNPICQMNDSDIFTWCEIDPIVRYPKAASVVRTFVPSSEEATISWNPLIMRFFERSPDIYSILSSINTNLTPGVTHGSVSNVISQRAKVFLTLFSHKNKDISKWAKEKYDKALISAREAQEREARDYRSRAESFE